MNKREFLSAGIGACLGLSTFRRTFAQSNGNSSPRKAKTTKLFKSPDGFPNAIAATPEGLWIGEQKESGQGAINYHLPEPQDLTEHAWLVDWNGKVLKTVATQSRNTSGMAVGGGYVWMCANSAPFGIYQVDMQSKQVSHRQIPLGPPDNGGGCHGAMWQDGKLWIASLRLRAILRVDPASWQPEFLIPFYQSPEKSRYHATAWDNGAIWQIAGNDCKRYTDYRPALVKYDAATGKVLEIVEFLPGSCDPHGLTMRDGVLISCDAGIHPNWTVNESPSSGWIFRIDLV
jgi:streptogramin lyase